MTRDEHWSRELLAEAYPILTEYAIDRATRAINDQALEENRSLRLSIMEIGFNPDRVLERRNYSRS